MTSKYHEATAVAMQPRGEDAQLVENLRSGVAKTLEALGRRTGLRFHSVSVERAGLITYSVTGGVVSGPDMTDLQQQFQGTQQSSVNNVTYITVPLALARVRDTRHALWRHIYIAGMVICLCGVVYFSGLLAEERREINA